MPVLVKTWSNLVGKQAILPSWTLSLLSKKYVYTDMACTVSQFQVFNQSLSLVNTDRSKIHLK